MRIAVIADTHDRLPQQVRMTIASADQIWHLGDVCSPILLDSIQELGPPVKVVRGNCDDCEEWPEVLNVKLEGFRIRLVHVPPKTPLGNVDLLLHGHTHVPRNDLIGRTRFLNPGCITRPNRGAPPSYGWLELTAGKSPGWSLERI